MSELHHRILELVAANNGQYSWYQFDRCLSEAGVEHSGRLMVLLQELVDDGLIRAGMEPNPAQPRYSITEAGVSMIKMPKTQDSQDV